MGSIPGWGTKIPQATWCSQKKRKRKVLTERVGEPPWLQEMVGQRWTVWQRGGELAAGSECKCLAFPPVLLLCSVTLGKSLSLRARWGPSCSSPGRESREVKGGASLANWAGLVEVRVSGCQNRVNLEVLNLVLL